MKKLMIVAVLSIILFSCKKEDPKPQEPANYRCIECEEMNGTQKPFTLCDDTISINSTLELMQNQNEVYGFKWVCKYKSK